MSQETSSDKADDQSSEVRCKLLPLSRIVVDPTNMQVRGRTDSRKVQEFVEIIKEQGVMDPMEVFYEGSPSSEMSFLLADGFSRCEAYKLAGKEFAPCNIRFGSRSKALMLALYRNGHHGSRMTNAEKRSAAEKAVLDAEASALPDLRIAKIIGCSATLVAQCRRGETREQASDKTRERTQRSSGKQESESASPRPATARERKPKADPRPTKTACMRQITEWIDKDVIDEDDIIQSLSSAVAEYRWVPKPGSPVGLKVISKTGREQLSCKVLIKSMDIDQIVLKSEEQKIGIVDE